MAYLAHTFSGKLRKCRKRKGYTQAILSDLIGIPQPNLSQMENGTRMPSMYQFTNFCNILDCSPNDLLGGDNDDTGS